MTFYTFNQNNSGGSFDFDESAGITHWVIIEAEGSAQALAKADAIGIYFNGCAAGIDCECCGGRWYDSTCYDANEFPAVYGDNATIMSWDKKISTWMEPGKECCIHYADGRKEWFGKSEK